MEEVQVPTCRLPAEFQGIRDWSYRRGNAKEAFLRQVKIVIDAVNQAAVRETQVAISLKCGFHLSRDFLVVSTVKAAEVFNRSKFGLDLLLDEFGCTVEEDVRSVEIILGIFPHLRSDARASRQWTVRAPGRLGGLLDGSTLLPEVAPTRVRPRRANVGPS